MRGFFVWLVDGCCSCSVVVIVYLFLKTLPQAIPA